MTRINVVPVEELVREHLIAEYREIVRVFTLVRKAQQSGINKYNFKQKKKVPDKYTLGTGHVLFFYNKLRYVLNRYHALTNEMIKRNYKPNPIGDNDLTDRIDNSWFGDYSVTQEALEINRKRIQERVPK